MTQQSISDKFYLREEWPYWLDWRGRQAYRYVVAARRRTSTAKC